MKPAFMTVFGFISAQQCSNRSNFSTTSTTLTWCVRWTPVLQDSIFRKSWTEILHLLQSWKATTKWNLLWQRKKRAVNNPNVTATITQLLLLLYIVVHNNSSSQNRFQPEVLGPAFLCSALKLWICLCEFVSHL